MTQNPSIRNERPRSALRTRGGIVVLGLALLLPSVLHAQARTVRNGGFEQPVLSVDWLGVADSSVPGWTSPDGVIEIWRSGFNGVPSVSGGQHAEANADSPSGFWQDVCLVAGESVPWSFHHRGRSGLDSMRVTLGGVEIARVGTGTGAWVRYSGTFVAASSGPARVQFTPLNSGSVGNFVDDVTVALDPHVEVGPDATFDEDTGGAARLFVSGTLATAQTVDLVVTGGSAQAGSDFSVTTTVTIPAGRYDGTAATAVSVPLGIRNDGIAEGDETLVYELANPSGNLRLAAARASACGSPARSAATVTIVDDDEVDLKVEKDGPDEDVQAGVDVTYEIETKNDGPDDAVGVVVTDTLPVGAIFVSATRGATESGGVVTWPAIDLADGVELFDSITLRFGVGGVQDQIAAATSLVPDRDPDDNRDVIEVEVCGFTVTTVSTVAQLRAATEDECVETIRLLPGTYLLTSSGSDELRIESDKEYLNAGGGTVVIDGGGASRVFRIEDNTVTLFDGLEIVGGAVTGGDDGGAFRTRGDVTIRNTLVAGNSSEDRGGGVYQDGGALLMENVTVTGNTSDDRGGGLSLRSNATLRHVTVAANRSRDDGAGISREGGGRGPLLENVLVADNVGPGGQIRRAVRTSGVNLVEGGCTGCRAGVDLTGDPGLAPLAQNGGATRTMALPAGSAARNAAPNVLGLDQRGVSRPQGAASDIGAFEAIEVPPAVTVDADAASVARLPSNGVAYRESFTLTNDGGTAAVYDLAALGTTPTVVIDSIRGPGVSSSGSRPDSARTASLAAGSTLAVSVWYRVGEVALGATSPVELRATDVAAPAATDRATTTVTVARPRLGLTRTAAVAGDTVPGSLITYEMRVTNSGSEGAELVVLSDSIPVELDFQVGSTAETLPAGLSATVEFATSAGAWGYTPTSGGCGADPGFDACVRFVRWTLSDTLPATPGSNVGEFVFTSIIR